VTFDRNERRRVARMVARILARWDRSTADDLAAGLEWYATARRSAARIAESAGLSVRTVAGIIAALSPRVHWRTNLVWAATLALASTAGLPCPPVSFGSARDKAWRIARGADPLSVLSGPKVVRFYRNLMGDCDSVTVDVWTALAAEGRSVSRAPDRRRYLLIEESYRQAARILGRSPRDVQAAVWVQIRGSGV
jgi:hypothetical protein